MKRKFNSHDIRLIVGLGNPGSRYENTYHNAGYFIVDTIAQARGDHFSTANRLMPFEITHGELPLLMKPTTFMNDSGKALTKALTKFRIQKEAVLIIHDDTDLSFGTYKMTFGSRSAGHHGIDSIIAALGTQEFWRARIGVRKDASKNLTRMRAGDFVLKKMKKEEQILLLKTAHDFISLFSPTVTERP